MWLGSIGLKLVLNSHYISIELALYYNIRYIIIKGRSVYKSHRYSGIIENKVILADSHSC